VRASTDPNSAAARRRAVAGGGGVFAGGDAALRFSFDVVMHFRGHFGFETSAGKRATKTG